MSEQDFAQSTQEWATGGGGEGDPADSVVDIRATLDAEISTFANLVTDVNDVPSTARERYTDFFSPDDLEGYLSQGGLLHAASNSPKDFNVNDILYVLRYEPFSDTDDVIYRLWIDDDT